MRLLLALVLLLPSVAAQPADDELLRALLASLGMPHAEASADAGEADPRQVEALPAGAIVVGSVMGEWGGEQQVIVFARHPDARDALTDRYRGDGPDGWTVKRLREIEQTAMSSVSVCPESGGGVEVGLRIMDRPRGGSYVLSSLSSVDCETGAYVSDGPLPPPPPPPAPPEATPSDSRLSLPEGVEQVSRDEAPGQPTVFRLRGDVAPDVLFDHLAATLAADGWVELNRSVDGAVGVASWQWGNGGRSVATAVVRPSFGNTHYVVTVLR